MKDYGIHFLASILLGMSLTAHILNGDWFAALWCAVAWVLLVLHYQATSERDLYREILSESLSKAKAAPETKVDTEKMREALEKAFGTIQGFICGQVTREQNRATLAIIRSALGMASKGGMACLSSAPHAAPRANLKGAKA